MLGDHADWTDLSTRRAGALAREQAVAHKQAAPFRTLLARLFNVHNDERAWRIGADGEELVGAELATLGPRWHALHAVPIGDKGSDIDHVVVGPGGVFTLNAKHHPGASIWVFKDCVKVNNTKTPYVRNSRYEARRASKLLSQACGFPVPVTAAVVPVRANKVTVKAEPDDVRIVTQRALADWLRTRPQVLSDEQVAEVYEMARRSTTWVPAAKTSKKKTARPVVVPAQSVVVTEAPVAPPQLSADRGWWWDGAAWVPWWQAPAEALAAAGLALPYPAEPTADLSPADVSSFVDGTRR